jgi:hypothetical protein
MKQFQGPMTTLTVLKAVEWQEMERKFSLPPGSYAATPTLVHDVVNNVDSPLQWTIVVGERSLVMGASQALEFASTGMLQIDGWAIEQLTL